LGSSCVAFTTANSASPPKFVSNPHARRSAASMESWWATGSSLSTYAGLVTTLSPTCHCRTAAPFRTTTPEASEPSTCVSRSWRGSLLPRRSRKAKVGIGSNIADHTVLKLIALAMTATSTSSGASSGIGTSPTCSDLRTSLSTPIVPWGARPNMPTSSLRMWAAL
jgi:hypothetical protein